MSALPPIATAKADIRKSSFLLCLRKRTCAVQTQMSAKGQKRTCAMRLVRHVARTQPRAKHLALIVARSAIARRPMILVVFRPAVFYDITYVFENKKRKGRHALFLFWAK